MPQLAEHLFILDTPTLPLFVQSVIVSPFNVYGSIFLLLGCCD